MVVRIQGENIPMNKRAEIALTVIFGIGRSRARKILLQNNIKNKKIEDLTEEEINKIRYCIERGGGDDFKTAGALRTQIFNDIKSLKDIGCYRGIRHIKGLPVRGQRTKTNCRTRKGPRKTVANKKKAEK